MFWKIFSFEIQNRIRRPVTYLYFAAILVFTVLSFATGSLPLGEKEHINSPYMISFWCAAMTMMTMLVSSSVMGDALYRDIEYNTKDYYLTYPITKAGYFWGRYTGAFCCMILIASAILVGVYIGSKLGPWMDWTDPKRYGPDKWSFYFLPFLTIALPNLFFTSSVFFGLIALTRNVKVIYSGGILLFLGYFLSTFYLHNTNNLTLITLADPFVINATRFAINNDGYLQKNSHPLVLQGNFLLNRLLWCGIALLIILYTYIRFNFEKFFSGKRDKASIDETTGLPRTTNVIQPKICFNKTYNRKTLFTLTRLELTNIFRDNYFWIIVSAGMAFLGFVFFMGNRQFNVPDLPRTVMLFGIFDDTFPFFIFFVLIFYTGEALHRDRVTRYAFINDSLPPPNRVLNGSKLLALLLLGSSLALIPVLLGPMIQIIKGYHEFRFEVYGLYFFVLLLPHLLEMVLFCYAVHVMINNKFIGHAVGISLWVLMFILRASGKFDYNLLLYSYTPNYNVTDMDGIGHMLAPVSWFNAYWILFGCLLAVVAALFFVRGVPGSFRERWLLMRTRFDKRTKIVSATLLAAFFAVACFNYYNVNYLNDYLMKWEKENRSVVYEKTLKQYEALPLPKVAGIIMQSDLFPEEQRITTHALIKLVNKNSLPVNKLLLDAGDITSYAIQQNGKPVPFTCPLLYKRGFLNWFRPAKDTAEFRLYTLNTAIAPGDTVELELNSLMQPDGFSNNLFAADRLRNGIFFNGGLPGMGYDKDEELSNPHDRKKAGLPARKEASEIAQDDPTGRTTLRAGSESDRFQTDITISTAADQTALAPGQLQAQWQANGRNYFHFVQDKPGMYAPMGILSAKYAVAVDSIQLDQKVRMSVLYHPFHGRNLQHYLTAYKEGLRYYSAAYGAYPFDNITLAETSGYGPREANMTSIGTNAEYYGWNADFSDPNAFDYCYFNAARALAQQWWRFQVAPNNTVGSMNISEGLANYSALVLEERKLGPANIKPIIQDQLWSYLFIRRRDINEHPLIRANFWYLWSGKASVALYGLRDLIGEDSMNAALRDFKNEYAFKSNGPFAGANDLYRCLFKHTPDSLRYFLTDSWQKVTLYDNKIKSVSVKPTSSKNEFNVTLQVEVSKAWIDEKGNEQVAKDMNDYIDIGVLGDGNNNAAGRWQTNTLFLKKYKLTAGLHTISVIVQGKPKQAGVDPFAKLIDREPNDNMKRVDNK